MSAIILDYLNYRKKQLEKERKKLNPGHVASFAYNFRDHLLKFFDKSKNAAANAIMWKKLNLDERKTHLSQVFKHLLSFKGGKTGDVKVKFQSHLPGCENALGSANKDSITIYDKALKSDDYETVLEVGGHEATHVFDLHGHGPTLDKKSVDNCANNYVSPNEDADAYRNNPVEVSAFETGRIIRKNFLKTLVDYAVNSNARERAA